MERGPREVWLLQVVAHVVVLAREEVQTLQQALLPFALPHEQPLPLPDAFSGPRLPPEPISHFLQLSSGVRHSDGFVQGERLGPLALGSTCRHLHYHSPSSVDIFYFARSCGVCVRCGADAFVVGLGVGYGGFVLLFRVPIWR